MRAFLTPDETVVLVVLNRVFTATEFSIEAPNGGGWINYEIPAHGIATFSFPKL